MPKKMMKKSSSELKRIAKQTLLGRYSLPMGAYALTITISLAINSAISIAFPGTSTTALIFSTISTLIVSLLLSILSVGMYSILLNLSRNKEHSFNNLFFAFTHQPDRIILLGILVSLIVSVCVIPGIIIIIFGALVNALFIELLGILCMIAGLIISVILELAYSQVYFIYLDDPEKGIFQIMRESREIMRGNKGRLFYLRISFIGISLLSLLTFSIALLWVFPYIECTYAGFYRNLRGEI